MIYRVICYFAGHQRGKRISDENGLRTYACPRCGTQWTRGKSRVPAGAASSPPPELSQSPAKGGQQ